MAVKNLGAAPSSASDADTKGARDAAIAAALASTVQSSDSTVLNVIKVTQATYDAISPRVATTLYVIVG